MIQINLLPHREVARKKRRELFIAQLGLAFLVGGLLSGSIYVWYSTQIDRQMGRNAFLQTEIKKLDAEIKDIANLQKQLDSLKARQAAVESLQADRNLPVHLLNEMVAQLPEGVYLTSLKQDNVTITLNGVAQSQERVSEFLRNLSHNSQWLKQPQLVEIVAGNVALTKSDQRRVFNFALRVTLSKGDEAASKEQIPAAPAKGKA
jgi:type IV pilus assembly protein PilN